MNKTILILSHQGVGFVAFLRDAATEMGIKIKILSSKSESRDVSESLAPITDDFEITGGTYLTESDVSAYLQRAKANGTEIHGCISAWEGYRSLMAEGNRSLGTPDNPVEKIQSTLNKYKTRRLLFDNGLSKVQCDIATEDNLDAFKHGGIKKFVKPCRGLGSFATFPLNQEVTWEALVNLKREMVEDKDCEGVFNEDNVFIVEDYIDGTEFAFEVMVLDGKPYLMMVSEKPVLTENKFSVLEEVVSVPAPSLNSTEINDARTLIQSSLKVLELTQGLFHIELRFSRKSNRWEIIEVNPRIGGSFFNQCFEIINNYSLCGIWIEGITTEGDERRDLHNKLAQIERKTIAKDTYRGCIFRVYYGEPDKVISKIAWNKIKFPVKISRCYVKEKVKTANSQKEIFLAEALWTYDYFKTNLREQLYRESQDALTVEYE